MSSLVSEGIKQNEGKNCVCVPSLISPMVSVVVKAPCLLTLCALKVSAFKLRACVCECVPASVCVRTSVCTCVGVWGDGEGVHARVCFCMCVCVRARACSSLNHRPDITGIVDWA